jgi:hypothetical protein
MCGPHNYIQRQIKYQRAAVLIHFLFFYTKICLKISHLSNFVLKKKIAGQEMEPHAARGPPG